MATHLNCGRMRPSGSRVTFARPAPALRARSVAQRRPAAAQRMVVRAGLGSYLAEAATAIFSPTHNPEQDTVPWGEGSFSGEIAHHNEVAKLRRLHSVVKSTRQQLAGCIDPSASNYNPDAVVDDGTCEYVFQEPGQKEFKGTLGSYIGEALSSVMGSNNPAQNDGKAADFDNTVFSYGGDKVSQRDIQRLLSFERVVKKTLDKAEGQIEEA